jgi:hypothetical protein
MAASTTNANANGEQAKANAAANRANVQQAKAKNAAERAKTAPEDNADQAEANAAANRANVEQAQAKAAAERAKATADKAAQGAAEVAEEATGRFEENLGLVTKTAMVNSERVQEVNSALVESSKAISRTLVDNYARAAKSLFGIQRQLAGTARVEWMKDAATTQIQFAEDVTDAWAKAARELLK